MSHEKPDDLCDKLARAIFEFFETRQIRAPESKRQTYDELPARYRRDYLRYANDAILPIVARTVAEGRAALTEVERQARHIEELQQKVDAEKSCACSYDEPGDVCQAHSPALAKALAEIERLRSIHTGHQPSIGPGKPPLITPDQSSSRRKQENGQ